MATHHQLSPQAGFRPPQVPPPPGAHPHMQPNGHVQRQAQPATLTEWLNNKNEGCWVEIGRFAESLNDIETAKQAYQNALRFNQWSIDALNSIAAILRSEDKFEAAAEYLRTIIKAQPNNGDTWGALGHCYLMMDELQQAYSAYQQALYHLADPKEPKLWYGIGILYDRYGSLEHAEEAFSQVMRMQPDFDKANEIYFRLGIIYKQQQKYRESLECFKYIVSNPPQPLTQEDIWFQIGHVHEQQKDFEAAKNAYRRVLDRDPNHAKVLQQLGWLYHQQSQNYNSQEQAIEYLEKSVNSDQNDAQSWYLLGRCYMSQTKYPKAYEAYQQAVYRDGRNPTFWCSIGVLYYQINQYRDALDAYSRAIRLNPNISEVWYDLGTLYESCNNQTNDALDAYQRAADLDPNNTHIKARLQLLRNGHQPGLPNQGPGPVPQDVHPQAYQPAAVNGPPHPQWGAPAPSQGTAHPQTAPPPLNTGGDWNHRRLADIHNPQSSTQPPQIPPYDQRDAARGHAQPRPASPRRDQIRYPDAHRQPPMQRPQSPSPRARHDGPPPYQASQPPQHASAQAHHQSPAPSRITNPNFGGPAANTLPPASASGLAAPPNQGPLPSYGRMNSPPPEIRPIVDGRPRSPGSGYPSQPQNYAHHANPSGPSGIANGAPAPASALAAAEAAQAAAARDREDNGRSSSATGKRQRSWEDQGEGASLKKPASDENRAKIEDEQSRRHSPPDKDVEMQEPPAEPTLSREEELRRADEKYTPSAAAHQPQPLNTTQILEPGSRKAQETTIPPIKEVDAPPAAEEHTAEKQELPPMQLQEPAARKMDVDEDYDDTGDEDKASNNGAAIKSASQQGGTSRKGTPPQAASPSNQPVTNGNSLPKVETAA